MSGSVALLALGVEAPLGHRLQLGQDRRDVQAGMDQSEVPHRPSGEGRQPLGLAPDPTCGVG